MSPELIAIIVMGLTLAGMLIAFDIRMERRVNRLIRRIDRLEELMMQRFDAMEARLSGLAQGQAQINTRLIGLEQGQVRMNTRLIGLEQGQAQINTRLIGLEQSQAHLAGEMSTLREAILLRAAIQG